MLTLEAVIAFTFLERRLFTPHPKGAPRRAISAKRVAQHTCDSPRERRLMNRRLEPSPFSTVCACASWVWECVFV